MGLAPGRRVSGVGSGFRVGWRTAGGGGGGVISVFQGFFASIGGIFGLVGMVAGLLFYGV